MTGPDDAFLAPDDALRDVDEVVDLAADEDDGPTAPSADDEAGPYGAAGTGVTPG